MAKKLTDTEMREIVFRALDNAVRNGHVIQVQDSISVSVDLADLEFDLEGQPVERITGFVVEWSQKNPEAGRLA